MSTAPRRRPGWQSAILQDLVFFQRGYDITKAEQKPGNIPVVSSSGVNSYHSEAKVDGPGVVIGRKGSLGTVHYVDGPYWPHDTTLWSRDFKGNLPRFVFYFLQTLGLERYDVGNSNPTLNRNHIHRLDILLPEYQIQERIVEVLSAYDDLIENNRRRIQLLEEAARLLYREWFVNLRFPGHEHVAIKDGVPEGWERKTLGDVAPLSYGKALKQDDRVSGPFPVYGSSGIVGTHVKALVPGPTIIVGRKGNVGSVYWSSEDCHPIDTVYYIDSSRCSFHLYYALQHMSFINTDVAVPGLNRNFAHSRSILIPEQKIYRLFEDTVAPMHLQIDLLCKENVALAQARDLLLPRLMNGEIAV